MSSTVVDMQTGELFDSAGYKVPFPPVDGKEVTDLALTLTGSIAFNRNDPEHAAMMEALTLGKRVKLEVYAVVVSKKDSERYTAQGDEILLHQVQLRAEDVRPA